MGIAQVRKADYLACAHWIISCQWTCGVLGFTIISTPCLAHLMSKHQDGDERTPPPKKKQLEASLTNQWCHGGYVHLLYYLLLSLPFLSKRKGQPLITLLVDKYRCSSYFENFGIANKSASFLSGQFAVLDVAGLSLQRMPHPTDRHSIILNFSHAKLTEAARLYKDCCRHMQSNTVTLETAARQEVHRRDRFIPTICSSYKV